MRPCQKATHRNSTSGRHQEALTFELKFYLVLLDNYTTRQAFSIVSAREDLDS